MSYPIDKYRFIQSGNKVIALSSYAGKTVRGVAKCSSEDTFSLEKGKELAAARCAVKVTSKRYKRAMAKVEQARIELKKAQSYYRKMYQYANDATDALHEARDTLSEFCYTL